MLWKQKGKYCTNQSKMWLSNQRFLANLNAGNLLPATIHKQADYLQRLQEKSLLIQMGEYSQLQDMMDRREIIAFKNKYLAPIFQELKTAIRMMTYTEEYKILKQFKDLKNVIQAKHSANTQESKKVLFELYLRHSQLLAKLHAEQSIPEVKLQVLEEQVDQIRTVLALWEYYTYIIYLPDSQVYGMMEMQAREGLEESESDLKKIKERFEQVKLGEDAGYKSVLEEETSDTSEGDEELYRKHDIVKEDMLGEMEDNDELANYSEIELMDQIKDRVGKQSVGFQFKSKGSEASFISAQSLKGLVQAQKVKASDRRIKTWGFIEQIYQNEKQQERFNSDEATVVSGQSQNFLDRVAVKDGKRFIARESLSLKQEDLLAKYEQSFLESQSGSLYGENEEHSKQVDQMVEEMNFQKLGLKQFMQAQNLDRLYEENPNFDAYERMRIHDTARTMVEEMNLMKESLSSTRTPQSTQEVHIMGQDEKRSSEAAHISLVVEHYIKQLKQVRDGRLEPKYLAKKRSILKKLEAMKEIEVIDPKILLQIHERVGYKLPEFDLE